MILERKEKRDSSLQLCSYGYGSSCDDVSLLCQSAGRFCTHPLYTFGTARTPCPPMPEYALTGSSVMVLSVALRSILPTILASSASPSLLGSTSTTSIVLANLLVTYA